MGTIRLEQPAPKRARRRLPSFRIRYPRPWLAAILVAAVVIATPAWVQAVLLVCALLIVYAEGWVDGRRDMALDLLRPRRDDRGARPAPRAERTEPADEVQP